MSKTDERRLDRIECSLTPKQAFLVWLTEARKHASLTDYVLAQRGKPIEWHPYRRLPKQVEQAVRAANETKEPPWKGAPRSVRTVEQAKEELRIENEVIRAVREVAFYLELHNALTGRISAEWKAMALQVLLTLGTSRELMQAEAPTQKEIDQARHWVVQSAGDLLMAQSMASKLADQYTDGRSLLFPEQERLIVESVETALMLIEYFNDHMRWLAYLRDDSRRLRSKRKQATEIAPSLNLSLIDADELHAAVEREATIATTQIVLIAKSEAAQFVGQQELAGELLDRVWVGVE